MTHKFKVGDEVWVKAKIFAIDPRENVCVSLEGLAACLVEPKAILVYNPPFLIEGRTYRCRDPKLTATVSKNERGAWIATLITGMRISVSETGFVYTSHNHDHDLIALLPEPMICKCCGQVVKETE